jgi:hypothetical protein
MSLLARIVLLAFVDATAAFCWCWLLQLDGILHP